MHPWHDIKVGESAPSLVNSVIEVPMGSKNKYELDKETGFMRVDRVLFSSVHYPANYGFIPQTLCEDNDPLDILVLGQVPVHPMCIMEAKPIGVMHMVDQGEEDDKIIAVHANDPEFKHICSIDELSDHKKNEIQRFFKDYKILEKKEVIIDKMDGPKVALEVVTKAIELYTKTYGSKSK